MDNERAEDPNPDDYELFWQPSTCGQYISVLKRTWSFDRGLFWDSTECVMSKSVYESKKLQGLIPKDDIWCSSWGDDYGQRKS